MVTPAGPGCLVRSGEQCFKFGLGQECDETPFEALRRNSKYALDYTSMLGMAQRSVAIQGADRSKR